MLWISIQSKVLNENTPKMLRIWIQSEAVNEKNGQNVSDINPTLGFN